MVKRDYIFFEEETYIPVVIGELAPDFDIGCDIHSIENIPIEKRRVGQKVLIRTYGDGDVEAYLGHGKVHEWTAFPVYNTLRYRYEIEADSRLDFDIILHALEKTDIKKITEQQDWLLAASDIFGLTFQAWRNPRDKKLRTKGRNLQDCNTDWPVGVRINFEVSRQAYTHSKHQFDVFLAKIMELTDAYFICSTSFYDVHCIRDSEGYRIFRDFW